MKYFIGCQVRGEVAEYHRITCTDLANRFNIDNVADIAPAYITIKGPFERATIDAVDNIIALNTEVDPMPLELTGWNHFGTRTIYVDVKPKTPGAKQFIGSILQKLRTVGVQTMPNEMDPHLHLSVARFLNPKNYTDIMTYLSSVPAPKFDIMLDNLTIYSKESDADKTWKIVKTFPLLGVRK